jgi:hypothetical protein
MRYGPFFLCFLMFWGIMTPESALSQEKKSPKKIAALQVFENSPVVFGTVLAVRGPGKIIVHPNGTREVVGDIDLKPSDTYGAGRLAITGERNTQADLTFDRSVPLMPTGVAANSKITPGVVGDFVLFSTKIAAVSDVAKLNYFGMDTILVGATLSLSPESPPGRYTLQISPDLDYHGYGGQAPRNALKPRNPLSKQ